LKNLHIFIEDPIRKAVQEKIWEVKSRGTKFSDRFDFTRISELTWQMESRLLQAGLNYFKGLGDVSEFKKVIENIYDKPLFELLNMLGPEQNLKGLIINREDFLEITLRTIKEKRYNTLQEEYVWNKT